MKYNPEKYHRRSIRLKDYDYSQSGFYFITICTHNKGCLFGDIVNGEMQLNKLGETVSICWNAIPRHFPNVELDAFLVMPNHLHGIVIITNGGRGTACRAPTAEQFGKPVANSIPTIIRSFKSAVSKRINVLPCAQKTPVWQRNYYEHIIRNEDDLDEIREYIINNALKWDSDTENPGYKK